MFSRDLTASEIAADDDAADDVAMAEYEVTGGISHEAVRSWLLSWGTEAELTRPRIGD